MPTGGSRWLAEEAVYIPSRWKKGHLLFAQECLGEENLKPFTWNEMARGIFQFGSDPTIRDDTHDSGFPVAFFLARGSPYHSPPAVPVIPLSSFSPPSFLSGALTPT